MADQTDDLGIPMKPARAVQQAAIPPKAFDLSTPRAELAPPPAPASPPIPMPPRPGSQMARAPAQNGLQTGHSRGNGVEARKLIVGQGIALSGEITSCDRLVVEGSVRANLEDCQHMEIAETGLFDGVATIDDAEVRGRFEGDLVVRRRLLIRASGRVAGTISYAEIEIEAGGKISGSIQAP